MVVGTLFVGSAREAWSADEIWAASGEQGHRDKNVLLHKFRAERNVSVDALSPPTCKFVHAPLPLPPPPQAWVAGFGFTLWVVLWRIYTLMERLVEQHREARDLKAAVVRLQAEAASAAGAGQAGPRQAAASAAAPAAQPAVHAAPGERDDAAAMDDISEVAGALDAGDRLGGDEGGLRRRH